MNEFLRIVIPLTLILALYFTYLKVTRKSRILDEYAREHLHHPQQIYDFHHLHMKLSVRTKPGHAYRQPFLNALGKLVVDGTPIPGFYFIDGQEYSVPLNERQAELQNRKKITNCVHRIYHIARALDAMHHDENLSEFCDDFRPLVHNQNFTTFLLSHHKEEFFFIYDSCFKKEGQELISSGGQEAVFYFNNHMNQLEPIILEYRQKLLADALKRTAPSHEIAKKILEKEDF